MSNQSLHVTAKIETKNCSTLMKEEYHAIDSSHECCKSMRDLINTFFKSKASVTKKIAGFSIRDEGRNGCESSLTKCLRY